MTTPAGWYPDPANAAQQRWWDGNQWTEHVYPPPVQQAPVAQPYAPVQVEEQEQAHTYEQVQQYDAQAYGQQQAEPTAQAPAQTEAVPLGAVAAADSYGEGAEAWSVDSAPPVEHQPEQGGLVETQAPAYATETQPAAPAYEVAGMEQGVSWDSQPAAVTSETSVAEAVGYQPYAQTSAPATQPVAGHAPAMTSEGVGGIRSELLTDQRYVEVGSGERVTRQNNRLLKVMLGPEVLARQGSMVAFQGSVDFDHEGAGAARFLKKALTSEGLPLMRCTGQGELFLADGAKYVHIIWLDNAGLSVNGRNVLAFEPSLNWDIERVQGASMITGGLFNTRLQGSGWVAITTKGEPVVLRTDQPTFVDTDAVVAWSAGLTATINRTMKAKALIGKGSGEAAQLALHGVGIVIVQPSEGDAVALHTR